MHTKQRILNYLGCFEGKRMPTQREIAKYFGKSVSTVNEHINNLEKAGLIRRDKRERNTGAGRNIKVVK